MKRIRKGDKVKVIAGRSRGHIGEVKCVYNDKVIVYGASMVKKHVKPNPQKNESGGIISKESWISVSNVAIYNVDKIDKIGFKFIKKDGLDLKVRYFKSDGELVDIV